MKKLILAFFLVGCGDNLDPSAVDPPPAGPPTIVVGPELGCHLDGYSCRCTVPEWNAEMLAEVSHQCTVISAVAADFH